MDLLQKMYNFYKSRYEGKELEEKFNAACKDLIESGDISAGVYIEFCMDNDIIPVTGRKKVTKSTRGITIPRRPISDGCGGGGGYGRVGC